MLDPEPITLEGGLALPVLDLLLERFHAKRCRYSICSSSFKNTSTLTWFCSCMCRCEFAAVFWTNDQAESVDHDYDVLLKADRNHVFFMCAISIVGWVGFKIIWDNCMAG